MYLANEYPMAWCLSAPGSLKSCTVSLRTSGLLTQHQSVCSRVSAIAHVLWGHVGDGAAGPVISLLVPQLDIAQVGCKAPLDWQSKADSHTHVSRYPPPREDHPPPPRPAKGGLKHTLGTYREGGTHDYSGSVQHRAVQPQRNYRGRVMIKLDSGVLAIARRAR